MDDSWLQQTLDGLGLAEHLQNLHGRVTRVTAGLVTCAELGELGVTNSHHREIIVAALQKMVAADPHQFCMDPSRPRAYHAGEGVGFRALLPGEQGAAVPHRDRVPQPPPDQIGHDDRRADFLWQLGARGGQYQEDSGNPGGRHVACLPDHITLAMKGLAVDASAARTAAREEAKATKKGHSAEPKAEVQQAKAMQKAHRAEQKAEAQQAKATKKAQRAEQKAEAEGVQQARAAQWAAQALETKQKEAARVEQVKSAVAAREQSKVEQITAKQVASKATAQQGALDGGLMADQVDKVQQLMELHKQGLLDDDELATIMKQVVE
jgi:hypothetical protein